MCESTDKISLKFDFGLSLLLLYGPKFIRYFISFLYFDLAKGGASASASLNLPMVASLWLQLQPP